MNEKDIIETAISSIPHFTGVSFGNFVSPTNKDISIIDGWLTAYYKNKSKRFAVLVKKHLHKALLVRILSESAKPIPNLMIITDQIGDEHLELIVNSNVAFLDMAGNMSIDMPGRSTLITGRKLPKRMRQSKPGRAFQTSGLKLVYALLTDLCDHGHTHDALINQPFRTINSKTGISLGSIGWILNDLKDSGYIVMDGNIRLVVDRKKLLDKWVANYIYRLRPKLKDKRFSAKSSDWWKKTVLDKSDQLWGGEVAASKLTGFLKPQIITIYSTSPINNLILDNGLKVDPDGNIEWLKTFWKSPIQYKECTHPILVYADLISSSIDRNMETARRIYEKYLSDFIEKS